MLARKELLSKVKNVHLDKCADCLAGKQNRASFRPRTLMRRKNSMELVHTDVCQVDAKSHASGQYFVTFIDDNNRLVAVKSIEGRGVVDHRSGIYGGRRRRH